MHLIFADRGNFVLRKLDMKTGIVSTFAGNWMLKKGFADGGTQSALFQNVFSVTVDSAGYLFSKSYFRNYLCSRY